MIKDYHKVLGVPKSANKMEIKSAYRKLALKFHPDKNSSEKAHQRFVEINEAYAFLSNENQEKIPVFEKVAKDNTDLSDELLKKRMEWARNYAKYKKIKEDNIAKVSFHEIQNSILGWLIPLFSWLSISYALILFLDFQVLSTNSYPVDYDFDYSIYSNGTVVLSLTGTEEDAIDYDEFAIDVDRVKELNEAVRNNSTIFCEFTPILNQEVFLSFDINENKVKLLNYHSTYSIFYIYIIILLLPLITILSKGPNIVYVLSTYFLSSIVFFAVIIITISLLF